jgi:hypothetical protein
MKFLLVKGINGFGNMISVLNYAYTLAIDTNRILVIDWRHPEWELDFDRYFSWINPNICKYMRYEDFINLNPKDFSTYPSIFSSKLELSLSEIIPNIDAGGDESYKKIFFNSIEMSKMSFYTIVVFSWNYLGYSNIKNMWNNIKFSEEILDKINESKLLLDSYKSIHVRHTDIRNKNLDWVFNFIESNLDKNIYVGTDNEMILRLCRSKHSHIFNFTTFYELNKPLHQLSCNKEQRHKINIDTIVDLILLYSSNWLEITPIKTIPFMSTYSMLAKTLAMSYKPTI